MGNDIEVDLVVDVNGDEIGYLQYGEIIPLIKFKDIIKYPIKGTNFEFETINERRN